ncbi:hypothetical protein RND81_11G045600 [Saponaria officinalis]|uniref:RNase H type-1 domain-containing protein n=1 Tax=Saponaria officinalis TaxID=3572 RepID=A0AAW1HGW0_SAPOF
MGSTESVETCRLLMLAWAIWNERNHVFHGGEHTNPCRISNHASNYLCQHGDLMHKGTVRRDDIGEKEHHWKRPPEGFWKVNIDGVVFKDKGSGLGVVIRDL